MRTLAQNAPETASAKSGVARRAPVEQIREMSPIQQLQRRMGNQALQRMLQAQARGATEDAPARDSASAHPNASQTVVRADAPGGIQRKLTINAPGDVYEQEADRVAEQVMRMPEPGHSSAAEAPVRAGAENSPTHVQTKSVQAGDSGGAVAPPIVHDVLRSPGQPLDAATRAFMEPRFGQDFGGVRVHTDARAAQAAESIGAHAFTINRDIYFGPDKHGPQNMASRQLLAHELAHVTQQTSHTILRQTEQEDSGKTSQKLTTQKQGDDDTKQQEIDEKAEEVKTVVLSRGVLQMTSEGDFTEGDYSVKRPHFPFNVNIFETLSADEIKAYDDAKSEHEVNKKKNPKLGQFKAPYTRYGTPDSNGVFQADPAGAYKMGALKDRHATATYTAKLADGQQLGTTNSSGVTISYGVDLGNRYSSQAEAKKDFVAAGILDDKGAGVGGNKADKLLDAVGLKGLKAAEKAATLRSEGTELTATQALKLLNAIIPDYDKGGAVKDYKRGDGTLDPAVEEVVMALSYWGGNTDVRKAIVSDAKGKEGAAQFTAAANAIRTNKSDAAWMQRGYQIMISYLELLAEIADAGYEITMSDTVSDADTLSGAEDDTLQFINDLSERAQDVSKDLKKQMTGTALTPLILAPVGEGKTAENNEADVTAIQQLLYNGDYDVEVTGKYDDKTKAAIEKFTKDEFKTASTTVRPGDKTVRHLKQFQYLKRKT